ncbi:MAG: phosphoribosylglycinamide formyltransferase [candidate division WOR-3 bacterium]
MPKVGIGVLASGRGSNFEALTRTLKRNAVEGEVRVVVANVPEAPVLQRARVLGIPAVLINHRDYKSRESFELALIAELKRHDVRLVCLAGFMRILSPVFVHYYENRIMNIHPSLLPAFAGLQGIEVHRAVIESGVKITGCTVHFVNEQVDAGPIIIQRAIPVRKDDTPESLAVRVLIEEHQAYPEAVRLFCENRLEIRGRRVLVH